MKKLVGMGLIFFVAAGSSLFPLWLTPTDTQAETLGATPPQFQTVAHTPATAEALPGQPIPAGQVGRVHEVYFHEGQRVRQGQVLLKVLERLPSVQQQQLQARLHHQLQALATLERRLPAATAPELAAARRQLADTRQQMAHCVPMLSFVYVTAPADGIITGPTATLGDALLAHTPVATLTQELPADTTLLLTSVE
ncbi:RND family efflux transporter [Hymenobacter metallilatus]|uniref:Biotin/lipoyl-binding protein n=1 Tax=Hymenobacter metallilatus TaxID=2493666 RepID=A0A3R9LYE0_9BACT|nr:biotin/lipoyl-binding protein [Hymenobacter metallilatus]RSK31215.1 biotin/lipoyl-binding protein [Hymenobacter metallilatus]